VLGLLRISGGNLLFAPSHRRLPHVGSKVAFPSDEVLQEIAGHNLEGAEIGHLALGEFVYAGDDARFVGDSWMQVRLPKVIPRFDITNLVSRRTLVFARAGFGKSNLNKLLFANLYKEVPIVNKRGRKAPVGTIIFDPDGEYFWPDDKGRPGLCDVPELEDKVVLFTNRKGPSPFYDSFVAGNIKLDIRRMRPADVISIALSPEKQDQQNVRKIKQMNDSDWAALVDEIFQKGNNADINTVKKLLNLESGQDVEAYAARANLTVIVKMLHDPSSTMLDMLMLSLKEGKLCIVDMSAMRGQAGLVLSGLILRRIFDHNQEEFTKAIPETIPIIAVVEEAQSVLGSDKGVTEEPFVTWVKEGRKYDLGAMLITQQPASIPHEILSQGDNWFIFHLLSSGDLQALKKANAHFSDDILSSLLNEPIPGNCFFWGSVRGKTYPLSIRVMSFESLYKVRDSNYNAPTGNTYALKLQENFINVENVSDFSDTYEPEGVVLNDNREILVKRVVKALKGSEVVTIIQKKGMPWIALQKEIEKNLPSSVFNKNDVAYSFVPQVLNELMGNEKWNTEKRPRKTGPGPDVLWIVAV